MALLLEALKALILESERARLLAEIELPERKLARLILDKRRAFEFAEAEETDNTEDAET